MKEEYRDIKGYENLYQVSNLGNVKSLNYKHTGKEKILKPLKHNNGYFRVPLSKQGKPKHFLIHRLVAQAFLPNPNNYPQVNHKDENKTNNNVTNLEFCTPEYNNNYGTRTEKTSKQVLCIETGKIYPSTREVERQFGFSSSNISKCCNGSYKTANGFHWKFVL